MTKLDEAVARMRAQCTTVAAEHGGIICPICGETDLGGYDFCSLECEQQWDDMTPAQRLALAQE